MGAIRGDMGAIRGDMGAICGDVGAICGDVGAARPSGPSPSLGLARMGSGDFKLRKKQ